MGAVASVVVDGHIVGGGEGVEGGAIFENIIGNKFDVARHRNGIQQRAVDKRLIAER